jgi:hypothetical protein
MKMTIDEIDDFDEDYADQSDVTSDDSYGSDYDQY